MNQNGYSASLRKTDIVNVDDGSHCLPPDRGPFSEYRVCDYYCPKEWNKDGVFVPVREGEPMWFDFQYNPECAVVVSVQKVNPVTGEKSSAKLTREPKQNYLVLPGQRWLDGYACEGKVYQFIATKSGIMAAVNEHVLSQDDQDSHAIGFAFFGLRNPKPQKEYVPYPVHHYHYDYHYYHPYKKYFCEPMWVGGHYNSSTGNLGILRSQAIGSTCKGLSDEPVGDQCFADADCLAESAPAAMNFCCAPAEKALEPAGASVDVVNTFGEGFDILAREAPEPRARTIVPQHFDKAAMGAGGRIVQAIQQDANTVEYYVEKPSLVMNYYLCLPEQFEHIMRQGRRQDIKRDRETHAGSVGGKRIPLIGRPVKRIK